MSMVLHEVFEKKKDEDDRKVQRDERDRERRRDIE